MPENTLLSPEKYNQLFTLHGTTMIFLFVIPVMAGFANYVLPLMIGARDMAFPRINAWSYWLLLFGGIVLYASLFFTPARGGLDVLPAAVVRRVTRRTAGIDAWIISLHIVGLEFDARGGELHRHDPQHARARHGLGPPAAVRAGRSSSTRT